MPDVSLSQYQARMEKSVEAFYKELSALRTGRASPSLLDSLIIDAYGASTPLKQIAAISAIDARTLSVSIWDNSLVASVEKAIMQSELGLTPKTEGSVIHLPMPALSGERRQEYAKLASKYAENARISIRNIRRDGIEELRKKEKEHEMSQDDMHRQSIELQKITDHNIALIDDTLQKKEQDILAP